MNTKRTKLTPERIDILAEALSAGMTYRLAALTAGIGESTLHEWLADARAGANGLKGELLRRLEEAEAVAARDMLDAWRDGAKTDWRAAESFMKRRYPDDYSERSEVTGAAGGPLEVKLAFDPTPKLDGGTDAADAAS